MGDGLVNVPGVSSSSTLKELLGAADGPVTARMLDQCFDVCAQLSDEGQTMTTVLLPSTMQCWCVAATRGAPDTALCAGWGAGASTYPALLLAMAAAHAAVSGSQSAVLLDRSPLDPSPFETLASALSRNTSTAAEAHERLDNHGTTEILRQATRREDAAREGTARAAIVEAPRRTAVLRLGSELLVHLRVA